MIKLIATDMDGTLLNDKKELPKDFFKTLEKLNLLDIKFVVASGRPYFTLYENFSPYSDNIYYIADNGAYIKEKNKSPIIDVINKELVNEIIDFCKDIPNTTLILCGTKAAYHMETSQNHINEINKYYIKKEIVKDLKEVNDQIFKITLCDMSNALSNSNNIVYPKYKDKLKVVVAGDIWLDMMNLNTDKGSALERIQKDDNISYEETMVFGDFYNDVEMLSKAKYSFVMENALEDMKQYGNYIAKSNNNNGVIDAINSFIK